MTANSIDMKHVYEKGLEPVDFIKYTLPLEANECEELISHIHMSVSHSRW